MYNSWKSSSEYSPKHISAQARNCSTCICSSDPHADCGHRQWWTVPRRRKYLECRCNDFIVQGIVDCSHGRGELGHAISGEGTCQGNNSTYKTHSSAPFLLTSRVRKISVTFASRLGIVLVARSKKEPARNDMIGQIQGDSSTWCFQWGIEMTGEWTLGEGSRQSKICCKRRGFRWEVNGLTSANPQQSVTRWWTQCIACYVSTIPYLKHPISVPQTPYNYLTKMF